MDVVLFGYLTVLICLIGYFLSWKSYRQGNYTAAILLIVFCGLLLRIYTSMDFFLHAWDERFHALVAKNLIQNPFKPTLYEHPIFSYDYTNWIGSHIWLTKPPVPLWFMASSIYLFGNNEIAVRIPSIIVSVAAVFLTYSIAKSLFNNKVALLAAFLHSIHGMLIELSGGRVSSDHVETFFVFFIELAVWFAVVFGITKKREYLFIIGCGLATGLAVLSKFLAAFIVLPIWLSIMLFYKKAPIKQISLKFILLLFISVLLPACWFLYVFLSFPIEAGEMISSFMNPLNTVVENHAKPLFYYITNIRIIYSELIYLPLIWIIYQSVKQWKSEPYFPIVIWIFIPFIVFSFAETKRFTYLAIAAPALFIATSTFFYWVLGLTKQFKHKWILYVILFLIVALPIRYSIERVKPFEAQDRNPQWAKELRQLDKENISNGILFNYDRPIEAMFYTRLTAYPYLPVKETLNDLIERGFTIIIDDNDDIPQEISEMGNVVIIKLQSEREN